MQEMTSSGYEILYPQTIAAQIEDVYSKDEAISAATKALYGLGADAVPDDAFNKLTASVLHKTVPRFTKVVQKLNNFSVGQTIKLNEGGEFVEFYVAQRDYESELNGVGRTLMVRKNCYDNRRWGSPSVNAYATSAIDAWLNSTYKNLLDADIRSAIGTTKIKYTHGSGNNTVGTLERAIFQLSVTELGGSASYVNTEGTALSIANSLRIAYLNGYSASQWTRSPRSFGTTDACFLDIQGNVNYNSCNNALGSRPAFTLPSDFEYACYTDQNGNLYSEQEYETILTDISETPIQNLGFLKVDAGTYIGTGTYGKNNKNTLTFPFVPRLVMIGEDNHLQIRYPGFIYFGQAKTYSTGATSSPEAVVEVEGTKFSWYGESASGQKNNKGEIYRYTAIG